MEKKGYCYPMLFVSFIEDFNGKEEILKASHTKKKIRVIIFCFGCFLCPLSLILKLIKIKDKAYSMRSQVLLAQQIEDLKRVIIFSFVCFLYPLSLIR